MAKVLSFDIMIEDLYDIFKINFVNPNSYVSIICIFINIFVIQF